MFKIMLNGMWSKDYLASLAQVLSDNLGCDLEESLLRIRDLGAGKRMHVLAPNVGKAHELACDLLQYGCYTEITQVQPLTDEAFIADLKDWFDEDMRSFKVVADAAGQVSKILEDRNFAFLYVETQGIRNWVGAELIKLGAEQVDPQDWPALNARLQTAIAENEVRRMDLRAERAAAKKRLLDQGFQEEE